MSAVPPDLEAIPSLTELRTPPRPAKPSDRRARRAEAALVRAEAAVRASGARVPLAAVEPRAVPHVRLGLAWAAVTVGAVQLGRGWTAAWFAAAAAVTAGQLARAWRRRGVRPVQPVAMLVAAALPAAAVSGAGAMAGVVVLGLTLTLAARLLLATGPALGKPTRDAAFTLAAAIPVGLAAATPVLVRGLGRTEAFVLVAFVFAYDSASFVVGAGAGNRWEGPVAGVVATVPVTLVTAAVLVEPFSGASPWLLGLAAAAGAPLGQAAGRVLAAGVDAPGVGRLDSLLALGPVWAWAASALLR